MDFICWLLAIPPPDAFDPDGDFSKTPCLSRVGHRNLPGYCMASLAIALFYLWHKKLAGAGRLSADEISYGKQVFAIGGIGLGILFSCLAGKTVLWDQWANRGAFPADVDRKALGRAASEPELNGKISPGHHV